jgi:ATP-binding cassette, subfamily B, heavy metal transporter
MFSCMLIAGYAVVNGHMTIGSWIAVQSWVATVFAPLNFLGSIYGAVYQAFIDIRNLSELLAQKPDLVDKPNAEDLPMGNTFVANHQEVTGTFPL